MNPTERTIAFLRNLTFDGFISGEEVWALAAFLNDNPEARHAWPGNILFPMLHLAFADSELTEAEMHALAQAISGIEHHWISQRAPTLLPLAPEAEDDESDESLLKRPEFPSLNFSVEVPSFTGNDRYNVGLVSQTCNCPDWFSRSKWPIGHPGRCCKHVAWAYGEVDFFHLEPWLLAIVGDCKFRGKGTHPRDDWFLIQLPRRKPLVVSGGSGDWYNVFASTAEGYERYGYNRPEDRWSYGDAPRGAAHIKRAIRESFPVL